MLHRSGPSEAYRRVEIDAYVAGSDARFLTMLCLQEAIAALDRALFADRDKRIELRAKSTSRAYSCIDALCMGVDPKQPLGEALLTVYGSARHRLKDSLSAFEPQSILSLRSDLDDLHQAFANG